MPTLSNGHLAHLDGVQPKEDRLDETTLNNVESQIEFMVGQLTENVPMLVAALEEMGRRIMPLYLDGAPREERKRALLELAAAATYLYDSA